MMRAFEERGWRRAAVRAAAVPILIAAGGAACGDLRNGIDAGGGSGIGEADGDSVHRASVPAYTASEEARIDGYAHELVPIPEVGVALARDGTIAVMQRQDHRIRFFDASGDSIASVGRRGAGPGEFSMLSRMGWLGDTLWVYDYGLRRLSLISPDWKTVRTRARFPVLSLPLAGSGGPDAYIAYGYHVAALYPDTTVLAWVFASSGFDEAGFDGSPVLRAGVDGENVRVVALREPSKGFIVWAVRSPSGGMSGALEYVPFYPHPLGGVSPDGQRLATLVSRHSGPEAGTFRLTVLDPGGDTVFARAYPFDGVPIPEHVADSVIEARLESGALPTTTAKRAFESGARRLMPDVYPPVDALLVANDHRIWLGLHATEGGKPWLVIDTNGEALGRVVLPPNATVAAARRWTAWTIELDRWDVPSLVRYRLEERT